MSVPFWMFWREVKQLKKLADLRISAEADVRYVQRSARLRSLFPMFYFRLFVKTMVVYGGVRFVGFFVPNRLRNLWISGVVRRYFRQYFRLRGVTFYKTSPFPKKPERPMLILTTKLHPFSSLFAYQLFDFPVLIPLSATFSRYRLLQRLPVTFMGKAFRTMSYTEGSLNVAWPHLKDLLRRGYSVVVHVNAITFDPLVPHKLPVYEAFKTILADEDLGADLFFLNLDGFERYPRSSLHSPIQVRCDLRPPSDVFPVDPKASFDQKVKECLRFFAIQDFAMVRPD